MMKKFAVLFGTIWMIILLSAVCMADNMLSLDEAVRQALINPPSSSKLKMYQLQLDYPADAKVTLTYPKVGIDVSQPYAADDNLSVQCRVSGDLSDYLLFPKRKEYSEMVKKQYDLNRLAAERDLIYSVLYPYLVLAELMQIQKVMCSSEKVFTDSLEKIQEQIAEKQLDPLYYQQAVIYKTRFDLMMLENDNQYAAMQRELANILGRSNPDEILVGEELATIQQKYHLMGNLDGAIVAKMLENDPELQVSKLTLEISKLNLRVKELEILVPDLNYNINGQYAKEVQASWGWSLSASWSWDQILQGTRLNISATEANSSLSLEVNSNPAGTERRKDEALLTNTNNLSTQTYKATNTYQGMVDSLGEAQYAMQLIKENRRLLEEQLTRVKNMPESPQRNIEQLRFTLDLINMEKSYYSQLRNLLFLEFQIKVAAGYFEFKI